VSKAFDRKLAAIAALRSLADPHEAVPALRKALRDKSNYIASKAAAMAGGLALRELVPDLIAAFDRFLADAAKTDPQCWAKNAIVKALKDLGHEDPQVYLRGMAHVQMEAVYKGHVDTAVTLRGASALALPACTLPRQETLTHLVDLLADTEKSVRSDAVMAIAQFPGPDVELLLRVKALAGDTEPEVMGQCFTSLLDLAPGDSIPFVARFLSREGDVSAEGATALAACPREEAVNALTARLAKTRGHESRRAILLALSASRLESARDFLLSMVEKGSERDAVAAVESLSASRFKDEVAERLRRAAASRGGQVEAALRDRR
jgi:HEAT repeat protein